MKKRSIALLVALSLCVGSAVGGTLAWLKASTNDVVNTFTIGDINIDLNEHQYDASTGDLTSEVVKTNNNYKYVPGAKLKKDPYVTVAANSEACWLFIEVTETHNNPNNMDDIIKWTVDTSEGGWEIVPDQTHVWYRKVSATTTATDFYILKDNEVTVNEAIEKSMVETLKTNKPTLTFKAYAVQSANLKDSNSSDVTTAEAAWDLAKNN